MGIWLVVGSIIAVIYDERYSISKKQSNRRFASILGHLFGMLIITLIWPLVLIKMLIKR